MSRCSSCRACTMVGGGAAGVGAGAGAGAEAGAGVGGGGGVEGWEEGGGRSGVGWRPRLQVREALREVRHEVGGSRLIERVRCGPALDVPRQVGLA